MAAVPNHPTLPDKIPSQVVPPGPDFPANLNAMAATLGQYTSALYAALALTDPKLVQVPYLMDLGANHDARLANAGALTPLAPGATLADVIVKVNALLAALGENAT